MGSLQQAYQSIYYNEQELREEVAEFCNEFFFDTEEETEYFVEELFKDEDIVLEFFDDVLEFSSEFQLNEDTYITEIRSALIKQGLKLGQGLLKKATPAVRGMSAKTLTKQGIQAGGLTQKGTKLAAINKPALATQTRAIQTARVERQIGIPKTQEPNKYLNMLQQKRASRGLPPAGQTTAGTAKAKGERGWLRHKVAVDQANTVATAFMKSLETSAKAAQKAQKVSAASSKLATAAKGTKNIGPAIPMTGAKPNTGAGLIGTRNVPNIKQVSRKYGMDVPAPKPAWGGKPKDPWSTSSGLVNKPKVPKSPSAETAKKVQAALPSAKDMKALPPGKSGGAIIPSKSGSISTVPPIKGVKVRDLGASPKSGGPTRYQGTRSGGQLSGTGVKALPATGQTSSRRSVAAATAAAAAAGTSGTGVKTGMTSAIVKRPPSLVDKVKNVMKGKGGKIATGAALLGLTGLAASKLGDGGQRGGVTKPEGGVLADKESPKTPAAPKVTAPKTPVAPKATAPKTPAAPKKTETKTTTTAIKKKMSKIDKDVEELMQMRASSMERQGRTKEAEELRGKIKAKYGDYER